MQKIELTGGNLCTHDGITFLKFKTAAPWAIGCAGIVCERGCYGQRSTVNGARPWALEEKGHITVMGQSKRAYEGKHGCNI